MVQLLAPPEEKRLPYDPPRNGLRDASIASISKEGMALYEKTVAKRKRALFNRLRRRLPSEGAVVVEVGMGSFPNAQYLGGGPVHMDIVGVDPNFFIKQYARRAAKSAGLIAAGSTLRIAQGVAEALPMSDGVADAVICTLTLCTVLDPVQAVAEVRRILKPGGQFLFFEHVLSETDPAVAEAQQAATPEHMQKADGCHLDRRTLQTIRAGGFQAVNSEYYELTGFGLLNPTVEGIAVA